MNGPFNALSRPVEKPVRAISRVVFIWRVCRPRLGGRERDQEDQVRQPSVARFPQSVDLFLLLRHRSVSTGRERQPRATGSPSRLSESKRYFRKESDKFISKSVTFRIRRFSSHRILIGLFALSIAFYLIIRFIEIALKIIQCDRTVIKKKEKRNYPMLIVSFFCFR